MNRNSHQNIIILLAEPQNAHRQYLLDQITRALPFAKVVQSLSVDETELLLRQDSFDLCLIGSGFSEQLQHHLSQFATDDKLMTSPCAVVAIVHRTANEALLSYVKHGAHGLLLPPISADSLSEVVKSAIKTAKKKAHSRKNQTEEVNSLPWVLEGFAQKLQDVASRLKTAELNGVVVEASPKLVTEALLSTIAASGENDDLAVTRVAQLLLKKGSKEQE